MPIIELRDLKKDYIVMEKQNGFVGALANLFVPKRKTIHAVDGISFTIDKGEIVGFIGPNGAGKSTTINILTGILVPTEGYVYVLGMSPQRERKLYVARIGAVFGQRTQLWWDLPLSDTFTLLKKIYRIPDPVYRENPATFDTLLGLDAFKSQPVRTLSLGQRMRADIAAALLHDPEIVFFDEPTIGLMFQLIAARADYLATFGHGVVGILLFVVAVNGVGINWTAANVLYLIVAIFSGVLIQGAIFVFFSCLNLWFIKTGDLFTIFYYNTRKFAGYPLAIFPKPIQNLLVFVVPFAFVNYFPAQYFLRKPDLAGLWEGFLYLSPVLAILLFGLVYLFWRASIRKYVNSGN